MKTIKKEVVLYLIFIIILWIFFVNFYHYSKNSKSNKNTAFTEVLIRNKIIKFGNAPEDTIVNIKFTLINIGNNPLIIDYINPDCSCTKCYITDSITQPKDSTEIIMSFNTKGKNGFNKLNSIIKLNTPVGMYKLSAIINVIENNILN